MSQQISVVLVDDDPHTCNLFEMVMDHHNILLKIFNDAETALTELPSLSPDFVVIDLFLPGLDGYQMLNRIQSKSLVPNSRFVATTAYYTNTTEQDIANRGFDGYIPKPIHTEALVSYLKSLK